MMLDLHVATEAFCVKDVVRPVYYGSSRFIERTDSGKAWNKVPGDHSHVIVPAGEYEVVDVIHTEILDGSDYCWVTYKTLAIIKSKKGSDRFYQVLVNMGGDCTPTKNGELIEA